MAAFDAESIRTNWGHADMTSVEYADESSRLLGAVVSARSAMLTQLAAGQPLEALEIGLTTLSQIDDWIRVQRDVSETSRPDVPLLIQRGSLIGDCMFAAVAHGDSEIVDQIFSRLDRTYPYNTIQPYRIRDSIYMDLGITTCVHGRPTLDPSGRCLMKPPCK